MQLRISSRIIACAVVALLMAGCSQGPRPGTPEAAATSERLLRSMSDTLAHSKSFTFATTERIEVIAPSGDKRVLHFTRKVAVRRPNALFFELHGEDNTAFDIAAYYSDKSLTLNDRLDGAWAQTTVPGTLDEMLDFVIRKFGLPVPIGDVVSLSPKDALIGSSARGGLVGWETIDHTTCAKLDYADALVDVRLWLPKSGQTLPRRIEIVYKQAPIPLVTQPNFSDWKLDVPVTDAAFTFQPPAGRAPVEFRDLVSVLVSRTLPSEIKPAASAESNGKSASQPAAR
jgi:hypothetical protein